MYIFREVRVTTIRLIMRVMCHCEMRATCLGGRGPYNAPLFNLPILPEQKWAGSKIIGFLKPTGPFVWLGHVASGGAEAKKVFMMSRRLWVFPGSMSFQ